ncbi:MAG: PEP-CTERM sorting domain-containing protein [Phycisphaerae bacterium]|nr:PEP-CTERM sorting domain-containing protein [Phycisphaerae bacterium]
MKLQLLTTCLMALCVASFAAADFIDFTPTPADLYDLDHGWYYTWGIQADVDVSNLVITGATLSFDDIRNWDSSSNDLWVHLLDSAPEGVRMYRDYGGGGDAFAMQGVLLEHYEDLPSTAQDITYTFSASEIQALNAYLQNGANFALGFDPDCHFYNEGVTLVLEYSGVPEPASMTLLASGAVLLFLRRRRT